MKTLKNYKYSFEHVQTRLKERYNEDISLKEYDDMNAFFKQHFIPALSIDNNGDQYIYDWWWPARKHVIRVVYSKSKKRITTVLSSICP